MLWSVIGEHLASWHPKGLGLNLAAQGTWGCSQAIGLTLHQERMFASCAGSPRKRSSPWWSTSVTRRLDFPTLAKGPEAFHHRAISVPLRPSSTGPSGSAAPAANGAGSTWGQLARCQAWLR